MILIKKLLKFYKSPSLTSWFNLSAKTATIIIILPLVNNYFPELDIFIWFTITTLWSIILLMDLGLNPIITRYFSYLSGSKNLSIIIDYDSNMGLDDIEILVQLISRIYNWLILAILIFIMPMVFYSIYEKISLSEGITEYFFILIFVFFCSIFYLKSNVYNGVAQGLGYLPRVQLLQGITALISCFLSIISVIFNGGLLWTVIAFYSPFFLYFFAIKKISNDIINVTFIKYEGSIAIDVTKIFQKKILNDALKSGFGILASQGFILFAALLINRIETIVVATNFMLGLQVIRTVTSYSNVPFYSFVPFYCKLYAEKKVYELKPVLIKNIFSSLFLYILISFLITIVILSDFGNFFFGQNFETKMWLCFVLAYFFERIGGLFVQVYTISGDVKWHIFNGGAALLSMFFLIVLKDYFNAYLLIFIFGISYIVWVIPLAVYYIYKVKLLN